MSSVKYELPGADDGVKYVIEKMNSLVEVSRKQMCLAPINGNPSMYKLFFGHVLDGIMALEEENRAKPNMPDRIACDNGVKFISQFFQQYTGPSGGHFEEFKTILLSLEADTLAH
eukprot:6184611-Pleurochrysis_carterae.AAC.1